jgi:hypothetical protein
MNYSKSSTKFINKRVYDSKTSQRREVKMAEDEDLEIDDTGGEDFDDYEG